MKPLEPRRRRTIVLATLPACMAGAITPLTAHLRTRPHGPALIFATVAVMCIPLGLAIRETVLVRREGGCGRS